MDTPPNSKPFRLEIERLRAENDRLRALIVEYAEARAVLNYWHNTPERLTRAEQALLAEAAKEVK